MKKATVKPATSAQMLKTLKISAKAYAKALVALGLDKTEKKPPRQKRVRHTHAPA